MSQEEKITAYMQRKYGRDQLTPDEACKELLMEPELVERELFIGRLEGLDVRSVAKYLIVSGIMRRHL